MEHRNTFLRFFKLNMSERKRQDNDETTTARYNKTAHDLTLYSPCLQAFLHCLV